MKGYIMPPPNPQSLLPYMTQGTLHMWFRILSSGDYPRSYRWIHCHHKLLMIGRHENQSQRRGYNNGSRGQIKIFKCCTFGFEGGGRCCPLRHTSSLYNLENGRKHSLVKPPEGIQPCFPSFLNIFLKKKSAACHALIFPLNIVRWVPITYRI